MSRRDQCRSRDRARFRCECALPPSIVRTSCSDAGGTPRLRAWHRMSQVWNSPAKGASLIEVHGTDNIPADRGCVLITYHHTATELAGLAVARIQDFDGIIFRFKDADFSDYVTARRKQLFRDSRNVEAFFHDGGNFKGIIRRLQAGNKMFYAPDIDLRSGNVTFRRFLGAQAPWEIPTGKLLRLANVDVVPYSVHRRSAKVVVRFHRAVVNKEEHLTADEIISRINKFIEDQVRREPADYLWIFKRFFTQPSLKGGAIYHGD